MSGTSSRAIICRSKRIRTRYLQDVGKGREQERKLEGSPSDCSGTNCTFCGSTETIAIHIFRPDFQHTRAICGLTLLIPKWGLQESLPESDPLYTCEDMATPDNQKTDTKRIIYVVDPKLSLRQRVVSILKKYSQDVKTFENAGNFLVELDATVPDCLIIGTELPGMGAVELLYQLKNQGVDIPVIVLGDVDDVPQAVSAIRAGAVDFIGKPFTDQKLRVCVKRMLEKAS